MTVALSSEVSGAAACSHTPATHPAHVQVSQAERRCWRRGKWSSRLLSYLNHSPCPRAGERNAAIGEVRGASACSHTLTTYPAQVQVSRAEYRCWR